MSHLDDGRCPTDFETFHCENAVGILRASYRLMRCHRKLVAAVAKLNFSLIASRHSASSSTVDGGGLGGGLVIDAFGTALEVRARVFATGSRRVAY